MFLNKSLRTTIGYCTVTKKSKKDAVKLRSSKTRTSEDIELKKKNLRREALKRNNGTKNTCGLKFRATQSERINKNIDHSRNNPMKVLENLVTAKKPKLEVAGTQDQD